MGRYNEILVGRFARGVQKLFGVKGEVPVGSLAGELVVSHGLATGVENRYLEGWNRFGAVTDAGPTAANQSGGRIRNPSGSNILAVMEKVVVSCSSNDRLLLQQGQATVDLGTVVAIQGNRLDQRGLQAPSLIVSQQSSAVSLPALTNQFTFFGPLCLANTPYDVIWDENMELTILPGDALQFSAVTVNERFLSGLIWRERFLEESERT